MRTASLVARTALVFSILSLPASVHAQQRQFLGDLAGIVSSEDGKTVTGATIQVVAGDGAQQAASSDAQGAFRIRGLARWRNDGRHFGVEPGADANDRIHGHAWVTLDGELLEAPEPVLAGRVRELYVYPPNA